MAKYLILLLGFWGCISLAEKNLSPADVNARSLSEFSTTNENISKAISATKQYLEGKNENIADFYVSDISENSEGNLVIPLWHKISFTMPISPGNPGGKNRNIIYNVNKGVVISQEWWQ